MSDVWALSSAAYAQEAINLHSAWYQTHFIVAKLSQAKKHCIVVSLLCSYRASAVNVTFNS
jgi:hypothetical protein